MSRYEVDSAQVAAASAAVRASTGAIRTEVGAMMRHLADLQTVWRGGAATAFGAVMADWAVTQARVEESLDAITVALGTAATSYADAEQQVSRLFGR
ncbi:WXG100 family type VII secretion target [Cellulomonas sp. ATA003]|uniref:WXG100 family type VII secretion target n=1 Tax=Cellulomonas sp. ATA003 TaxID=3073064 RepID=UPI00287329BD|nr:WXG100 family type VII secretion target [Cellulomonas sp. ATA003]WNB85273.1 WXG100 family type VII secretion target [Cellulomonas sp. ATA003]